MDGNNTIPRKGWLIHRCELPGTEEVGMDRVFNMEKPGVINAMRITDFKLTSICVYVDMPPNPVDHSP